MTNFSQRSAEHLEFLEDVASAAMDQVSMLSNIFPSSLLMRPNKLECLYWQSLSSLVKHFLKTPGAYPRRKHLKGAPIGLPLALPSKSKTWLERVSKGKPSSLLGLIINDKGKKFYNNDTRVKWWTAALSNKMEVKMKQAIWMKKLKWKSQSLWCKKYIWYFVYLILHNMWLLVQSSPYNFSWGISDLFIQMPSLSRLIA